MNITTLLGNDTFITSVVFNDEAIEITYMEKGQQSSKVMQVNTIAFPVDANDAEKLEMIAQAQDLFRELIDRAFSERRAELNPSTAPARKRLTDLKGQE